MFNNLKILTLIFFSILCLPACQQMPSVDVPTTSFRMEQPKAVAVKDTILSSNPIASYESEDTLKGLKSVQNEVSINDNSAYITRINPNSVETKAGEEKTSPENKTTKTIAPTNAPKKDTKPSSEPTKVIEPTKVTQKETKPTENTNTKTLPANFDPKIHLDGKFNVFHQGNKGDCGLVSAIQALENSEFGRGFLKSLIVPNSDGSFTLNFGSGKFTVSAADVKNAPISGDFDARVIEAAVLKKTSEWGFAYWNFKTFTGYPENMMQNGRSSLEKIMSYMEASTSSGNGIIAACDFQLADSSRGIYGDGAHSYSIIAVTKSEVVVCNPYDTGGRIKLSREWFEKAIRYFTVVNESTKKVDVMFLN